MRRLPLLLALLFVLPLPPVGGQEEEDGGIEIGGCGPGQKQEQEPDDGYDPEETKRKNTGLAGGGRSDEDDDPGAPKVKIPLQERINQAIKNGVEWLKDRQDKEGSWGPVRATTRYDDPSVRGEFYRDELGPTAWAVYTLAKCGESKRDHAIRKGMRYIEEQTKYVFDVMGGEGKRDPERLQEPDRRNPRVLTNYESAAIVMMYEAVFEESAKLTGRQRKRRLYSDNPLQTPTGGRIPKDEWRAMHERIIALTVGRRGGGGGRARGGGGGRTIPGGQVPQGPNQGGWRYGQGTSGDADLSATQFVLLALRAASQAGYPVEKVAKSVWIDAAEYVRKCQRGDGGFGYQISGGGSTGSMTACGIGCLLICKEQMELAREIDSDNPSPPAWIDDSITRGMEWLDGNFVPGQNPGAAHHYYYLYGVERVGDLSGRKEFNGLDWYVRGAELLVEQQQGDGKWVDATAFPPQDVIGTCFALLFLKRATPPVITYRD